MFPMKKIEGGESCNYGYCSYFYLCKGDCYCYSSNPYTGEGSCYPVYSIKKKVEEHLNLCQSHTECTNKGSGNYCGRYPNSDIKYGFCFASISEAEDVFKMAYNSKFKNDFLKMPATTA